MRVLLINPRFPESFWSFRWAMQTVVPGRRAMNPPLGLATLAALSPEDWEVTIVDENIESIPAAPTADIIGICGMGVQFPRQKELLAYYRSRGHYVVAGGSYASLVPERFQGLADSVVAGEAEYIWPAFCNDFAAGRPKPLYHETGVVSLEDSPVPRFDLLKVHRYQAMSLQFSRGCPFRCEFCDIIVMFGRRPRTKSPEQIGRELDVLRRLGAHRVFFVDDNLIGNKKVAKQLLSYLADYQRVHDYRFWFGTEASLNLAQDTELLEHFRAASFGWLFIGIESPDQESLRETLKFQNTRQDLLESVNTVYRHGLDIFAGFIIGFDHDTPETFGRQERFIMRSGIQAAMIGLLTATERTPLYERLHKVGRIIPDANNADNVKLGTNVIPLRMTYDEMVHGYRALHHRLFSDRGIAGRVRQKVRYVRQRARGPRRSVRELLGITVRFLVHGLMRGGPGRLLHFAGSMPWWRPHLIPQAVEDWILGLSMRDYIERHFPRSEPALARTLLQAHVRRLEAALARYRQAGSLEISLENVRQTADNLSLTLSGWLDRRFFGRASRHLRRMLRCTRASVTLRIDHLDETHAPHLRRLLRRLTRHGDRVRICVHERVRHLVRVDSSVFELSFEN